MGQHPIGILINKLEVSDKVVSLIQSIKVKDHPNTIIFYNELPEKYVKNPCLLLHMSEAWTFRGPVISTCHYTTKQMINMYSPPKKFFYIWDLDWIYDTFEYDELYNIYMNPQIELLCRSLDHQKVISKCWREPKIIEDFNYERIL